MIGYTDDQANQLRELMHEACEAHCDECGACCGEGVVQTGIERWEDRGYHVHGDTTICDDCWTGDPTMGYNPGPEIAVTWNDTTLTIQRTHLHPDTARYYWRLMQDGMLEPVADGDIVVPSIVRPSIAARTLAWHLYANDTARKIMTHERFTLRIDNGAEHLPEYRDDIHMIHQEGLS